MNYKSLAFLFIRAPSKVIAIKKIDTKSQYDALLAEAKEKELLLYSASTTVKDGKELAKQPWVLIEASVPKHGPATITRHKFDEDGGTDKIADKTDDIRCPYCNKKMNSTSGRTLHIKAQHPDQLNNE